MIERVKIEIQNEDTQLILDMEEEKKRLEISSMSKKDLIGRL